eukprot:1153814-Pelagomonas_calceolata.AAC.1
MGMKFVSKSSCKLTVHSQLFELVKGKFIITSSTDAQEHGMKSHSSCNALLAATPPYLLILCNSLLSGIVVLKKHLTVQTKIGSNSLRCIRSSLATPGSS